MGYVVARGGGRKGRDMRKELKGTPCPSPLREAQRLMREKGYGQERAMAEGVRLVREWCEANGVAID